ncbi:cyclic nucleotide-binding domain-containing protein [Anaerolineales bacterium HSG6]|nr:cyclic nucleotide-binding domain-containing protein [Anaerolineales bacterium HSG6]MDM8532044.1 cyclic nucleotide-binding domain-containing protein [Anaerolineales bacterium HSG25]
METVELVKAEFDAGTADLIVRLRTVPYFSRLSEETLAKIADKAEDMYRGPGMRIVKLEETDNDFYIIEQGEVRRETYDSFGGFTHLKAYKRGDFFGQFSILHNVPHSVSVVAIAPTYLLKIPRAKFLSLIRECPDFGAIFEQKIVRDTNFIDRLKYLSFFELLDERELSSVVNLVEVQQLTKGTDLLEQKEAFDLVVISDGRIETTTNKTSVVKNISMSRGNFVDNLSTLNDVKVTLTENATVFTLTKQAAKRIVEQIPRLKEVFERKDVVKQLKQTPLFENFEDNDLNMLAWAASYVKVLPNRYICKQGEPGTRYLIIHKGEFEVRALKNGKKPIDGAPQIKVDATKSSAGEDVQTKPYLFGERAVFFGQPYPAGLWTHKTTEMFFINYSDFDYLKRHNPGIQRHFQPLPEIKEAFNYLTFEFSDKSDDEEVFYYTRRHWTSFFVSLFVPPIPSVQGLKNRTQNLSMSIESFVFGALLLTLFSYIFMPDIFGAIDLGSSFNTETFLFSETFWLIIRTFACFMLLFAGWMAWTYADWYNDYLMISSKRVLKREKIVLIYEDQAQAELGKIQNTSISVGFWGKMLGYCNITINTASADGQIYFNRSPYPSIIYGWIAWVPPFRWFLSTEKKVYAHEVLASIVHEQTGQGQLVSAQAQRNQMREAIQRQMEQSHKDPWDAARQAKKPKAKVSKRKQRFSSFKKRTSSIWNSIIPWRHVDVKPDPKNNVYVWRKHWTVLLSNSWDSLGSFVLFSTLVALYYWSYYYMGFDEYANSLWFVINGIIALVYAGIFFRFWYEAADWGNDLYILTPVQVIDVDKQPLLLSERRNQSDLSNIENVIFQQEGFLDNIFNIGDVLITTAGEEPLKFDRIGNPRQVQHVIYEQVQFAKTIKYVSAMHAQDTQFTEWFDVYHDTFVNLGGYG